MVKRYVYAIVTLLTLVIVGGCQQTDIDELGTGQNTQTNPNQQTSDNSMTDSHDEADDPSDSQDKQSANNNENKLNQEDNAVEEETESSDRVNDQQTRASNSERMNVSINKQEFKNAQTAVDEMDSYREIKQTNLDLGHGIKAFSEGATGHHYISWNEGNWLIQVNFPSDPQYAIDNYQSGEELAKSVVDRLEKIYLPAPEQRGVIKINGFSDNAETIVRWQEGNIVYAVKEQTSNPIAILNYIANEF
ncbi:hypothetical protein [Paraliobacillus ryukyuensis]|uniref:hypothetical protein n=1 Tax=Paraliobacillus ryukyuensis TaxID=200904 RepID=UPI0009A8424F|nr:hypothetical protein [Paraliobacillus ryukyuensis]